VRNVFAQFEDAAENDSTTVEQNAVTAYNGGNIPRALSILTAFTTSKLQDGFDLLKDMTTYAYSQTHGLYPPSPE
jgi:hypothetical protein